jgi:hypothetical protein
MRENDAFGAMRDLRQPPASCGVMEMREAVMIVNDLSVGGNLGSLQVTVETGE